MNGYVGKILRINLTEMKTRVILTADYEQWGGGHGMGSAIFYDIVVEENRVDLETIDGFSPENVVTIMTSPLSGTMVPVAGGRTEMQGIGVQSWPIGWFTRSNFGGRFSTQLKYAGWDGVVIEGKAAQPVWVDIRNDDVRIRNCGALSLWGMDTYECQKTIWDFVAGGKPYDDWFSPDGPAENQTVQRPAVLAVGPAGENLSRMACLIHDAGNAAGQGGFGAVWGSKNLKALSVTGTGAIGIADPNALIEARISQVENYAADLIKGKYSESGQSFGSVPLPIATPARSEGKRPQSCVSCHSGCRQRYKSGTANEATCMNSQFYLPQANTPEIQCQAVELTNRQGLNAYEVYWMLDFVIKVNQAGFLGPGKFINSNLDFDDLGSIEFARQFIDMIVYRPDDFGDAMAEGCIRAAERWNMLESALKKGFPACPYWGMPLHKEPRGEVYWAYGSIMGDREINEHDFNDLYNNPTRAALSGEEPFAAAREAVEIVTGKMAPYDDDPLMLDFSTDNIYSKHMAKLVSWHRHYTRFWKESMLFCDLRWADMLSAISPDKVGSTGEAEPGFFNIVTGKNLTFVEGNEIGRKIWNLDHAIWTLQGRHRDMVYLADYVYSVPLPKPTYLLPGRENGQWKYINAAGRYLDRDKFDEWKTLFYELEGWDPASGYPTRETLESLDLEYVADKLESQGRLGSVVERT